MPAVLPLSRRLQAMFAARISDLPALTFQLLLLAGQWALLTEVTEEGLMVCQTHEYRLLAVRPGPDPARLRRAAAPGQGHHRGAPT
jgi:hypothetical protein